MLKTWFWSWTRQNASELPLAIPCPDGRRQQEGPRHEWCLDLRWAGPILRWAIIGSALKGLFVTANLILLLPSLSSSWPPLLIFCSWQMAPLFLASSRNWSLLTGKERSRLEHGRWLSKETAPQPVGERLLRGPSWSSCEKTKLFFPSAASLVRSTASQADVASKGNKMSPAPASRFALLFFPPPFCRGLCAPGDVCSSVSTRLRHEQDACCIQAHSSSAGKEQQWDTATFTWHCLKPGTYNSPGWKGSVQPHLENLQWWGLYHVPGEVVAVTDCSHWEKFLFYIKKPLPAQLVLSMWLLLGKKGPPSSF